MKGGVKKIVEQELPSYNHPHRNTDSQLSTDKNKMNSTAH